MNKRTLTAQQGICTGPVPQLFCMRWGTERCSGKKNNRRRYAAHVSLFGRCIIYRLWFQAVYLMLYWFWQGVVLGGVRIQNNVVLYSLALDHAYLVAIYCSI